MIRPRSAFIAFAALALLAGAPPAALAHEVDHADHAAAGNPMATAVLSGAELVDSDGGTTGGHVTRQGNRLYVGAYGLGFRIFDVSNRENPVEIGGYLPGNRADAVPDAATYRVKGKTRHLAVLNGTRRTTFTQETRTDRSEFLDVTDPANPILLAEFVGQEDGEAHNGDIVDQRRLWLPSGGAGPDGINGLRIYDLRPTIRTPAAKCRPADADNPCAPVRLFNGNPVALWESSPFRQGRPVGAAFTHTHDVSVYVGHPVRMGGKTVKRDIVLLAEGGSYANDAGNTGSVFVIDITDPRKPVVLLRWMHETGPDHHPIRYHHEAQFLESDPRLMLVTDEDLHHPCGEDGGDPVDTAGGGVVAVRLSADLADATEFSEWFIPLGTPAPVCSVHVMSTRGSLMAFGSYNAGLQVVDFADPANPVRVAEAIMPGTTAWGALWYGDVIYIGDMTRGLDTFRYTGG
ncbi:MAG: hypothetical protein HY658_11700 [Actinobacteria bacterium]|nr:hypothetical protein [Actinomycetota bacterium]